MEQREQISRTIARIIRERSEAELLTQSGEIWTELVRQGLVKSEATDEPATFRAILGEAVQENTDLREISAGNGIAYYYSTRSLSETYAGILVSKEEGTLSVIARVVRENSKIYPRPVPLDFFLGPPFGLTHEDIFDCLEKMAELGEYQDIARTITSVGTVFLYSQRHLEPDHAFTLAEWMDVGQVNNP
jgi:hypothetical protein